MASQRLDCGLCGKLLVEALGVECDDSDRRRRVASDRLEYLDLGFYPDRSHLLGDEEPVLVVRDDDWRASVFDTPKTQDRVLDQSARGHKRQELFGKQPPRHGPQPAARPA